MVNSPYVGKGVQVPFDYGRFRDALFRGAGLRGRRRWLADISAAKYQAAFWAIAELGEAELVEPDGSGLR